MMSDDKTEFNQILETNPEFINWAKVSDALWHVTNGSGELKKEAMYHPPDQSESVSKYIERRLVERGWPNEIEQILVLIRDESNGQLILLWRCLINECFLCVLVQPISVRHLIQRAIY